MAVIYALLCPDTHVCRYVGYAASGTKRYKQHCRMSENSGNTKRQNWLHSLLVNGKKPIYLVLEDMPTDWQRAERAWIEYYRYYSGEALTNTADGGTSVKHLNASPKSHVSTGKRRSFSVVLAGLTRGDKYYKPDPERVKHIQEVVRRLKRDGLYAKFLDLWDEQYGKAD